MGKQWEHFYHQADIGVRGFGESVEEAFAQAAVAMTGVITEPEKIACVAEAKFSCEGTNLEMLFVDWLNAIIYEMAISKQIFGRFEVKIEGSRLSGKAWGEKIDIAKHEPTVEVKAATYAELKVRQRRNKSWVAQCVVDV